MGQHGSRQQKRLAKQKAKRTEKRTQLARGTSNDPSIRLRSVPEWSIVDTLVPTDLWERGMGQVIISRRTPDGNIACAVFLLDTWCLGVKNAMWKILSPAGYAEIVEKIDAVSSLIQVSPEYLSKLVHCAADYAQALGFAPHPDFRHARLLLEGIDPSQCPDIFEFGKDGQPFYFQGPHDSPDKVRRIMQQLNSPDVGGHFLITVGRPTDDAFGLIAQSDADDETDEDDTDEEEFDDEFTRQPRG